MTEILPFGQPLGAVMQVAYVVEDIEKAIHHWSSNLGIGPFYLFEHFPLLDAEYRGQPTKLDIHLALAFSGSMCFELIQQNDEAPSVYREMVDKRGYGFHHWGLSTREFDADVGRFRKAGADLALYGVAAVGARAAYMDTVPTLGGMIELIEILPPVEELFETIKEAAVDWDGRDPIRRLD